MTTPAPGPACEVCNQEPAFLSQMQIDNYDTIKVGLGCLPRFMITMATTMLTDVHEHTHINDPGLCQVCAAIHELMHAPAPRPEATALEDQAAAAPLEAAAAADPGPVATGPPAAAAAVPAEATTADPDHKRQLAAAAAQYSLLATFGVLEPDSAPCPVDGTRCYTAPGLVWFVCPFCGGRFAPDPPAGAEVVPDSESGTALVADDYVAQQNRAEQLAAADLPAEHRPSQPDEAPF